MKVLYVRNLTSDVTEDQLKEKFGTYGKVERVKKIKDYGFVHFEERDDAIKAMEALNGEVSKRGRCVLVGVLLSSCFSVPVLNVNI